MLSPIARLAQKLRSIPARHASTLDYAVACARGLNDGATRRRGRGRANESATLSRSRRPTQGRSLNDRYAADPFSLIFRVCTRTQLLWRLEEGRILCVHYLQRRGQSLLSPRMAGRNPCRWQKKAP